MYSEKSKIISELAELFELSLSIGTSLDIYKNAESFLSSLAQRKNIIYSSIWRKENDEFSFLYSFPNVQKKNDFFEQDDHVFRNLSGSREKKLNLLQHQIVLSSGQKSTKAWVFYNEDIYILLVQAEQDNLIEEREQSQLSTLLKKFCLSIKACISHNASLNEVIKRQEAEYRLFERESLFRFGANSLSEGLIVTDLEDKITYVNKAMTAITGYTKDEMFGTVANKLFLPKGYENFIEEVIDKKRKQDISDVYEVQQVKKDGSSYWVRITASAFKNAKGEIVGTIATMLDITESLNAQRAIAKSQKELQELVDTMYDGLIVLDDKGKILDANNSALQLFELNKDMLGQIYLEELVHPDERDTVAPNRLEVSKKGHLSTFVSKVLTPMGTTKIVEVSSSAIIKDGKYAGSRDVVRDITDKVRTRAEIDSKNLELQDLVENMYDALIVVDGDGRIKSLNKAGEHILGYNKEALKTLNLADIVHPEDKERSAEYLSKLVTQGFYSGYEGRIITGDDSIKEIEVNSTAIVENGKVVGSRDIIRDISERKELQRQRELSEMKLRLVIDTALDAVITMNAEGLITEWNKNSEQIFGFSIDEVLGKRLSEFIIPEKYREAHERGMKHYFASGEGPVLNSRIEITAIDKMSREFPIELAITPVKYEGKTFFSAFIRDITDRKEIEAQKEHLVAELESVNQELRDFAYIVSHDLKAPLRSIGSLSDWLIQDYTDVLDEEGKKLLVLLKTRIGRMHGLIEGVLQYSKVGRLADNKEKVNINVLLEETIDLLGPPSTCSVNIDINLPTVSYDKIRLQQVFQNLLSNAIKFLDKPKGEIAVRFTEDETHYHFAVVDNGPGIEKAYFQKIFQIFQTLRAKDDYESTGIGLSIVKRIVELNGGTLTVASEIGVGSTFSFTIPK